MYFDEFLILISNIVFYIIIFYLLKKVEEPVIKVRKVLSDF